MSYKGLVFAAAALAVACASTAANADYYYRGYDYGSRTWNSGYGNIRPSFWGYPALLLRGDQTKVIATADEIEAAREYREYEERYAYGRYYGGDYDGPGLLGLPGALLSRLSGAADGVFRDAAYGEDYTTDPNMAVPAFTAQEATTPVTTATATTAGRATSPLTTVRPMIAGLATSPLTKAAVTIAGRVTILHTTAPAMTAGRVTVPPITASRAAMGHTIAAATAAVRAAALAGAIEPALECVRKSAKRFSDKTHVKTRT